MWLRKCGLAYPLQTNLVFSNISLGGEKKTAPASFSLFRSARAMKPRMHMRRSLSLSQLGLDSEKCLVTFVRLLLAHNKTIIFVLRQARTFEETFHDNILPCRAQLLVKGCVKTSPRAEGRYDARLGFSLLIIVLVSVHG